MSDKPVVKILRFPNGNVKLKRYLVNDKCHRVDGPAVIRYDENGKVRAEIYCVNDKRHRIGGPAYIEYHENGKVRVEVYFVDDKITRLDGPAIIEYFDNGKVRREAYLVDGKLNRLDGPAYLEYFENGKVCNEGHWTDDKRNRVDGPAVIRRNEDGSVCSEQYWVDGKPHQPSETIKWSDRLRQANRTPRLYFVQSGDLVKFEGKCIEGCCTVVQSVSKKNGTTHYTLKLMPGVWAVPMVSPPHGMWGQNFSSWKEVFDEFCGVPRSKVKQVVGVEYPKLANRLDEIEKAIEQIR